MGRYIIMGIQGSGKGTQAKLLAAAFDLVHISMGAVFRAHIRSGTELGRIIHDCVAGGHLVPDAIVNKLLQARLAEADCAQGFILDGYPRNLSQAAFFLKNFSFDAVINIEMPDAEVTARMLGRRICTACNRDFNLQAGPPKAVGRCDHCGGSLARREDDTPEAIALRLADFHAQTRPVLDFFREHDLVVDADGSAAADVVQAEIRRKLKLTVD